ncbi:hypothetical protein PVAG01_10722 [Phlyctema vagabunda]|uniref:Calcineurin-like phosphoesterase domain-containing protein n=1 Tax=Phlyctema vagabunda TaxID=108571 RepID=A0ABR4P3F8_9HELO
MTNLLKSSVVRTSVPTRFLILSDTHNFQFNENKPWSLRRPVPKADVALHCGDLTNSGGSSNYRRAVDMMAEIDAELKIVIAGNHDRSLDEEHWIRSGGTSADTAEGLHIMTGPYAAAAGVTYLVEGTKSFILSNGATFTIYTSPYTPEFCGFAFAYDHEYDRFNTLSQTASGFTSIAQNPIPDTGIDIVMTHGPPKNMLDECPGGNVGCPSLLRAVARSKPLMHCFGHIHEGHGSKLVTWDQGNGIDKAEDVSCNYPESTVASIDKGQQTLMVNAAIMVNPPDWGGELTPQNPPWLVDLELPKAV